jgi:hypothetical protein
MISEPASLCLTVSSNLQTVFGIGVDILLFGGSERTKSMESNVVYFFKFQALTLVFLMTIADPSILEMMKPRDTVVPQDTIVTLIITALWFNTDLFWQLRRSS